MSTFATLLLVAVFIAAELAIGSGAWAIRFAGVGQLAGTGAFKCGRLLATLELQPFTWPALFRLTVVVATAILLPIGRKLDAVVEGLVWLTVAAATAAGNWPPDASC